MRKPAPTSAPKIARRRRAPLLAALALVLLSVAADASQHSRQPDQALAAGTPLVDALLTLQQRGLKLIFTNQTVRPDMRVHETPRADTPRGVLAQLLTPHGLAAREGPNGTVVVVAAAPPTTGSPHVLSGTVRSRGDGLPLAGVLLEVVETGERTTSAADGSFQLPLPGAGPYSVDVRRRGFVIEHLAGLGPNSNGGASSDLEVLLDPAPLTEEEVLVTPSRVSLLRDQPASPLALSRGEILALPHLGNDLFRALSLLPGVTGNDVSAEFHVRGGRSDETQVLLDGQELYEAFHLKDFDNALSIVADTTLESVDLSTGGFPVEHGDRMAGVLDMNTRTPARPRSAHVGISPFSLDLGGSGLYADDRGGWLLQGRRGAIDLVDRLLGPERPQFWDLFAKLDHQLTRGQNVRLNFLHSDDELEFEETGVDGFKSRETKYQSTYLWLTHQALIADDLLVESALSRSRVDRVRRGVELEDDAQFDIDDRRDLLVAGLRQDWSWFATPSHSLKWGFELRDFESIYDYSGIFDFDNPLAVIRTNPESSATAFMGRFEADHRSLYLSDRVRLGNVALELGLRHDHHTLTDEGVLSPRLNLALDLAPSTVVRASWGRFTQSQRPYELQVEDGETTFDPVERSEQRVLGVERLFGEGGRRTTTLRIEAYRRDIENPLQRYENLYEPINTFPEVEPDRVLIRPSSSRARGLELFVRSRGERFTWWANYAWSNIEDVMNGRRVPRRFDQPHALNLDLDIVLGVRWTLNLAWRYHTGWPTTPLSLQEVVVLRPDDTGELEEETLFLPVLGPPFSDRLPDYHRLDLRASRRWTRGPVEFTFFVDVQNAYDRRNVSGFDFEIDEDEGLLIPNQETWAQVLPSIGIRLDF